MAVNVKLEAEAAQEAASDTAPAQRPLLHEQERPPGGALAPRPEWIAPPSQQLVPIDRDIVAEIEELAGKEEAAQAINDIVRRELRSRRMQALLEELAEESGGPLTPEELAWAASLPWPK
jgi:Arc/MetJ family transcription regulator